MKILGVDPGSRVCGYGVIEKTGNKLTVIEYGVVKLDKKSELLPERLLEIFERILALIERTHPDTSAFESLFYFKNAQSLVKLAHARAAAVLAAVKNGLTISEYSPREVKKAVTGNGNAGKEQVQFMVKNLLNIKETPEFFDVTDALAVAICHALRSDSPQKTAKSWSQFVEQNQDRIVKF